MAPVVCNFGAGPAQIPREVLQKAQAELLDWHGSGISVMELSHRSAEFESIIKKAEADLRKLLSIPSNYKVLFMQGGGTGQFAAVPMNLISHPDDGKVEYIVTGTWSEKAYQEALRYSKGVHLAFKETPYTHVPDLTSWQPQSDARYVYYCDNETVNGIEFPFIPDTKNVPLVCDMSSNILSRQFDVSRYGLIFAGAQKNVGPAGVTIVIVREDLLARTKQSVTPTVFDYRLTAENGSLYNTPPTFAIYMAGLVFEWALEKGGIEALEAINKRKSEMIYKVIDESNGFYWCPVVEKDRSRMNVCFRIRHGDKVDDALEKKFLAGAEAKGMIQLKGHRSVGGIRASLYNAVPEEAVQLLRDYMLQFYEEHKQK